MQQEQTSHEKTVSDLKQHEVDVLERLKEQLQIEKSYQEQMQKLKADEQAEVDKYQQKYFDLLEQMKPRRQQLNKIKYTLLKVPFTRWNILLAEGIFLYLKLWFYFRC